MTTIVTPRDGVREKHTTGFSDLKDRLNRLSADYTDRDDARLAVRGVRIIGNEVVVIDRGADGEKVGEAFPSHFLR